MQASKNTIVAIIVLLVLVACINSYATTLYGDPYYDNQPGTSIGSNQVFLKNNSQENINPATGGLTIVVTDVNLPGRNGLDLNINRVYRSRHLVARASNQYASKHDFLPMWSNMGIGWKSFIAIFDRHTYDNPEIPSNTLRASLHLGDGRSVQFYRLSSSSSIYYSEGVEKWKVSITASGPVLYFENGIKYYFGCKLDKKTWGFYGDRDCVTKIEDNNGNYISIFYRGQSSGHAPESEIDYIIDTWKRRINYYWSDDGTYVYMGCNPKHKLDSIKIIPLDDSEIKTIKYYYGSLNVGYAKTRYATNPDEYLTTVNTVVSSLAEVKYNNQTIVKYKYGGTNGVPDYFDVNNLPNADRGQLVEVNYVWGGCDKYKYKLYCDEKVWNDKEASYFSMITSKGNDIQDDLLKFTYYREWVSPVQGYDTLRLFPGKTFWANCIVRNFNDSLKTIYYYRSMKSSLWSAYGDSTPIAYKIMDYDLSTNKLVRRKDYVWTARTFPVNASIIYKYAYLLQSLDIAGDIIQTKTAYDYPSNYDYSNYDNIIVLTEKNVDADREIRYGYIHFNDSRYCNDTTWLCNRMSSKSIYMRASGINTLNSLTRYIYDALPVLNYSSNPQYHSNKYHTTSYLARGNLNRVIDSLDISPRDSIMQTVKYDECGNVVQKISGSGNIVDFKYDLDVVGNIGQDKTKDPDYLRETWNLVYGKSNWFKFSCMGQKIIDWTPQEDTTYYNYEPIFYRPHKIIRKGDTDLRPSVLYEYHDIYPTYTKITRKQNEITDNYTSIFYYDKNGYLKNEQQGDIEIDYEHNNSGLLVMESIPHYLTEINPSKYKYFYDCLKRVKQIIYPDNSCTYNTFGGGVKKTFDSKGDSIIYNYDLFGRLSSVVDAINNTTSYMYNTIDNLTYIKTPDNKEYRFHYNPIGRLKGKYDVDTDTSYYHYNKDGNLDSLQDANLMASDKYLVNRYDPIGRIVRSLVKNNSDSIVLTQNYYDKYDFSDQNEYGQETPGESLSVSMPDNNSINYSLLPAQSSITSNDSILITYQPFVPLGQDTIASWTSPFDSYIDINGNVYNNDKLIVSSTPQAYNILYSFPIFSQRNRDITGSLLSPFETSLRPGAIIDSAVFSLHTVSFKDYASIKINVCNPLPFLSDGCVISPQAIPNAPSLNIDPYNAAGWHPFMFKDICQYFCDASLNDYNNDFDESYTFPSVKFAVDNPSIGYPHTEYYSGDNATTTDHPKLEIYLHSPDSETPKLARLSAEPSLNSCDINWNYSNDWTYDTLEWGNSPSYGNVIASNCTSLVHTANITGLNPRTEYHFRIKARDVTGNSTISGNYMFITDTLSFTAYSVSDVKTTSAVVKWELNWPAEVSLKYGLNPQCSFTAPIEQFSSCLTGLMPGKKYYVMLEAVNGFEKIKSPVFSFRTIGICMFSDSIGHLTKIIDQSGETVFGYDDLGRKTTKRVKYNDFNKYFYYHYNYDRANNLIYSTYPDGVVNTYNYDGYNNLCSFYKDNNKLKEFSYTASGACSTETYNNGVSSIYSYYPRLWLKNAVITKGASKYFSHEYSYDVVGNLIKDKDNTGLSSSIDRSYSYDPLNRLSNEIIGRMVSYDDDQILYDAMGNRIRNINTTYQYYPGTNRLQKEIAADGLEKTYGYDANGNMNNDGIWNYEYNAQNKLKKVYKYVSNGSTNIEYLYNASGLRIKEKKTDVVSNTNAALDAVTFPETFDDLVESAPTGDGHDDARDLGKLKVHVSDSFLFFTIEHKYLYGTSQGDYENIYIAMDTDQEFGSGSTLLPDDIKVSVSADNAWEYCAYVYSEKDFGIYIGEGFKLENLTTAGGKKMKVNFTNGKNSKAIIKIPLELIGNAKKIRFAIISTMPGAPSYVETSVCDVLPGGRLALDGTLITQYNEFVAPAPGTSITTVETKYNLYDDGGQALCDLDEYGNITRRYVYANGKHVAMDLPGNKDYMQNGGFEYGNFEYPLTPWIKWVPYALPACNWTIVSDVKRTGTYSLTAGPFVYSDPIDASTNTFENYAQNVSLPALPFIASCYMKAQDLTGGVYLLIECWTAGYGSFLGNVTSNLKTGTFDWSLISIPVNILPTGTGAVKITLQRLNGTGTVWVDDVRCEEGVSRKEDKSYYYHTDYLGSPRMMTDQLGNVIWRQDYYAFGADYNTSATGNTHKFTGHVQDVATGQYYAKARYFTTNNGRWSQPEPLLKGVPAKSFLGNPQKLNPYVYCLNNPIKFYDPNGLKIQYAPELEEYIKQAKKSKTFSKMFENLDKDETILLTIGSKILPAKVYGKTTFMPSSGQYSKSILMTIDLFKSYKYKTLGHEFKHAEEQADKNVKTMDDIKWDTMDDSGGGCTKAAAETGETVAREVENPETPPKEDPEKVEVLVGWDEVIEVSVDPDTGAWILP